MATLAFCGMYTIGSRYVNWSTMKDEYSLALALIIAQVMMVSVVVAVLASPWYSIYFYQMLKEQALENYRATSGKQPVEPSTAELAKYHSSPGIEASAIDMYVDEEIATRAIVEKPGAAKPFLNKFRQRVEEGRGDSDATLDMRQIALQKLIRLKILTAESYLRNSEPAQAEALTKSALKDLKEQNRNFDTAPQQINVEKLLDLTGRIQGVQGDNTGKNQTETVALSLLDPSVAKDWYHKNKLKGFEESYPVEYVIRYLLSSKKLNKLEAVQEALKICAGSSVRASSRVHVLHAVMKEAIGTGNTELENVALNFWMTHCSKTPIRFMPEASLVYSFKSAMHRSRSEEVFRAIVPKIEDGIKLDLLSRAQAQDYINEYEFRGQILKRWPPKNQREARTREREMARLTELAKSKGLYTCLVDIPRAFTLVVIDHPESAERLLLKAYREMHSLRSIITMNQASILSETFSVSQAVARTHTLAGYERAWKVVKTAMDSYDRWIPSSRLSLLENLYGYCGKGHEKEKIACLNEVIRITKNNKLDAATMRGVTFFILNNCIETGSLVAANKRFNDARREFGENSQEFCDVCCDLIMYRRAYPAYAPAALKVCNEEPFPNNAFQLAPRLAQRYYGNDSLKYLSSLQYLAQYEYCRGNHDRALSLCNEFQRNPSAEKSTLNLANSDLKAELTHEGGLRGDRFTAVPGSIVELTCLANVYNHVWNTKARDRVTALKSRVSERD
ncbi:MAG: hypothetical protein K2X93_28615 [Candidatus Obscuribacterales bacterium]|nr:hypothetical protein [Candidatus Obscuribacterales bacterium]